MNKKNLSSHLKVKDSSTWRTSEKVKRIVGPFGYSINCSSNIRSGERIFRLSGQLVSQPSKYTIQRWESEHLSPEGALWAWVNHACVPNCAIDFETWELVSRSPIRVGEEMTFNYNSTEWEISSPFNCRCGSPNCGQVIRGFRYLNGAQRDGLRALLSPYLRSLFFTTEQLSRVASSY
jgi:SET domain-containing protein